ncbi:unnamed protein product [Ectocarpus sp. CCAP 1310/34]|nr:unnamed protein product [Ectocarpus sp. CCAP 1310/34]
MKVVKKAVPNRKASAKKNDKAGSKASTIKKSTTAGTKPSRKRGAAGGGGAAGAAAAASDDEDDFVNRRAKKPKTGRVGRTAGKNYPPEIQAALGRARMLYVKGKVVEASTELSEVVIQCSSIPEPYALLAMIYQDGGKHEEALMFYKLACARDTKNWGNHQEVARIAGILGDHTSRLEALKVLARLRPNDLNVAIERARCLLELQKPKQALDVYAKAAKRFPRKLDIYLDLAECVECVSPQQNIFVHQALASCLRRVVGKRYLGPDVRDLADGFSARLREIKLEHPKPKRLPARRPGLPSKREGEVAMTATALLVGKLMESRKRQEPQYEVAVQVVEGLGSWLNSCHQIACRDDLEYESGEGGEDELENDGELDSDSDVRDSNDDGTDDEEDEGSNLDREGGSEDELDGNGNDEEEDEPMDNFELDPEIVLRYGICQLYCGEKEKADNALLFLKDEEADGPHGNMMLEVAKVYAETGYLVESLELLRNVAQSKHPRHRLASIQLGAAYASQGKHELASDTYTVVLAERPHHAAALAGIAEAAYWRGKGTVPAALSALTTAVKRATKTWTDGGLAAFPAEDDDEGEDATTFQRLQLLMQWATLSLMENNRADFACVAVPLVSVALGQLVQRQEFEQQKPPPVLAVRSPETARGGRAGPTKPGTPAGSKQGEQVKEVGEGAGAMSDQATRAKQRSLLWKPTKPVRRILGKLDWQVGLRGEVSTLTWRLLEATDVIAQVGRRAVFWHLVEVVRSLKALGSSDEVKKLVDAASQPNGLLRGLEKEDLQAVVTNADTAVLRTMPGGSPIHGPASREGFLLGPAITGNLSANPNGDDSPTAVALMSEQYYPPPWRCVEEKDDDGLPRRAGREWRPPTRSLHGTGQRRSRGRALMELDERKDDGDAICTTVRALSRRPGNDAMWNLMQRVAMERGVEQADGGFHGEQVEALVSRHRERPQGLLHRAHDAAIWNRAKHALKLYSHAHATRPEEPLPILCLAMHICRTVTVMETMVENDGVCVLQALACLHRYAHLRKERAQTAGEDDPTVASTSGSADATIPEAVLEQEIMYNLGRAYHQVGLPELAMEYYSRALQVKEERGDELRSWQGSDDGVTKETAHNMCALYKRNGQTAMALSVLNKYLAVG